MFLHLFQSKISIDLYFKKHYFKFLIETGHFAHSSTKESTATIKST